MYKPEKKPLPAWITMNDHITKHWMKSSDVDMESLDANMKSSDVDMEQTFDEIVHTKIGERVLKEYSKVICPKPKQWFTVFGSKTERVCDRIAFLRSNLKPRHYTCDSVASDFTDKDILVSDPRADMSHMSYMYNFGPYNGHIDKITSGCEMRSLISGNVFPEYEHCFKPGGMGNIDCQKACYVDPKQPGCETLTAKLSRSARRYKLNKLQKTNPAQWTTVR